MSIKFEDRERVYNYLKENSECDYVNDIYIFIKHNKFSVVPGKFDYFKINFIFLLSVVMSGLLILMNLLFTKNINFHEQLAITRVQREKDKIINVIASGQFIEDDIKNKDFTIYRINKRGSRIKFLLFSYVNLCCLEFKKIRKILDTAELQPYYYETLKMCAIRIPHMVVYSFALDHVFKNYELPMVYIGSTLERFALRSEGLAKEQGKKLICLPHGIETLEPMPGGYIGDIFYCSSQYMADQLNELYNESKFVYDAEVTRKMYEINFSEAKNIEKRKKFVYFTQPLYIEETKKIIHLLQEVLEGNGQKLYLKVHPLESSNNYEFPNVEFIEDINEALVENICVSFCSTVLIEALYNSSLSVSIANLIDSEFVLRPEGAFLRDGRIFLPQEKDELLEFIKEIVKNEFRKVMK